MTVSKFPELGDGSPRWLTDDVEIPEVERDDEDGNWRPVQDCAVPFAIVEENFMLASPVAWLHAAAFCIAVAEECQVEADEKKIDAGAKTLYEWTRGRNEWGWFLTCGSTKNRFRDLLRSGKVVINEEAGEE